MSATLSFASSGLGTKTGTTSATLIADLVTLINSKSGDSNFKWQVASSNSVTTPLYIVLKPKSGAAGRILLVIWTSAPAGNNAAILDQAPTTNALYGAYFPAGNVDTPSNLAASSGTILGDDTGAVKVWATMTVATIYAASIQPFYFDSDEGCYFAFQNPAAAAVYMSGAGALIVDAADNAYNCVVGFGTTALNTIGAANSTVMAWSVATAAAGNNTACVRTNYGASNRTYYIGLAPAGNWANVAISSTDILTDTANSRAYFVPIQLLGQVKGGGFELKLRQLGLGPGTVGAFTVYNTTGPAVAARQVNAATAGGNGYPWLTNFKL